MNNHREGYQNGSIQHIFRLGLILYSLAFSLELLLKLFSCRKFQLVFRGENLLAIIKDRVLDYGLILLGTQDDTNCRIVIRILVHRIKHTNVAVHLPDIPMCQLANLQVDKDMTL